MFDFKKAGKTIVYINGFAALNLDVDDMKKLLKEDVDRRDIFLFRNDVRFVPTELYNTLGKNFYNGICNEQFNIIKERDGVFINPLVLGFTNDYPIWVGELSEERDNLHIIYLDVPYETYLEGRNEMFTPIEEKEYIMNSDATKKLVASLKEAMKLSNVYH